MSANDATSAAIALAARSSSIVAAKRVVDVIGATSLLLLLLPVFVLIILIQFAAAPRAAVFYRQKRVGRGGTPFFCLKFRTMCPDADAALRDLLQRDHEAKAEWAASRKLRRDPRVTRVGTFLRTTSLDELPQIWNVLRGEMSLVGPRPVTETELTEWYERLGGASDYYAVRPGITGLWQVSGRSGTTYEHRVTLDCQYVRGLSLALDARILFRTLIEVARQRGAC